ncbi:MAG TPA: putative aminohydrolase SsnA [Calditrichaeota bacterium]|nr:putative aminohydrolase SsnA [Calditrichota bacterium]
MIQIIKNAHILTNDRQHPQAEALVIEDRYVAALGAQKDLEKQYPSATISDAGGRLVLPGFINAHMHFYSTYARGLAVDKAPNSFLQILSDLWWRLDKTLDDEAVYYSALIPTISAVKNGVTSVIDHHASPDAIDGSLDRIEDALSRVGLRATLCYEVSDRDGKEVAKAGLRENERYINKCARQKQKDDANLFSAMFGLHAAFTLGDDTLRAAAELGTKLDTGFHLHLAEGTDDDAQPQYGISTTERLHRFGILGAKTITAHAIHIADTDRELLARTDTIVVHNPQSNMNNTVGRADVFAMLKKGILVGLGTDGMTPSLFPDIRTAYLLHKHDLADPTVGWSEIRQIVMENNAQIYQRVSGQKVGKLAPGYVADLVMFDYYPPTPLTTENLWGHLLFGIADTPVHTVIINGRVILKDYRLTGIDEEEIAAKSREVAKRVWDKF